MFLPFILLFKARQLRGITKLSSLIAAIDSLFFLLCFLFTLNISSIDRPLRLMDLHLRKLLSSSDDDNSTKASDFFNKRGYCPVGCSEYCPYDCVVHSRKPKKLFIGISVAAALGVLLFCCYAVYVKYWVIPRSRRRSSEQERRIETREEFLDEEHGPVVEHHIWYINTVGLQPSVINSIAVCKYNRSDGLVDGTECPVCLNEFQEDESLRLLPKCSHAFHVSCIDTWLRSHTNCPLCRAPIIRNTAVLPTEASSAEETEEAVVEIIESDRAMDEGGNEMRVVELQGENERDENVDRMQPIRRSVSLASLSAFKITQALANGLVVGESAGDSELQPRRPDMEIVPKRGGGDQSLVKFMATSFGRSFQVGQTSLERSFSCSGELFLSRYYRNRNSVIPS